MQEKLICSDEKLAATDAAVAAAFKTVRDRFDPKRRASLIAGQRTWLRLRDEACPAGTDEDCLAGVYAARLKELEWQKTKLNEEKTQARATRIDLETFLDVPRKLAAYYPTEMSEMRLMIDEKEVKRRLPTTCREFFTLTSGAWSYGGDNIGENSEQSGHSQCLYALLDYQKWPLRSGVADKSKFLNLKFYSWEFGELVNTLDRDTKGKSVRSFAAEEAAGEIKIVTKKQGEQINDEACQRGDENLLVVSADGLTEFCIYGWVAHLGDKSFGDFTHSGRLEMLVPISAWGSGGGSSFRINSLPIVYYDEKTKSVRLASLPAGITPWGR